MQTDLVRMQDVFGLGHYFQIPNTIVDFVAVDVVDLKVRYVAIKERCGHYPMNG